jgi:predicted nucleic acid-binding protein
MQQYDENKILASLKYLMEFGEITLNTAIHLLYIADYNHLERYGRSIGGLTYVITPSGIKPQNEVHLLMLRGREYKIHNVAYDELSLSDLSALAYALEFKKNYADKIKDKIWLLTLRKYGVNTIVSYEKMATTMKDGHLLIEHLQHSH